MVRAVRRAHGRRVRRVAVAGEAEHLVRERAGAAVQVAAADHRQVTPLPADIRHAVQHVARVQLADRVALQPVALPPEVRRERDEAASVGAVLQHGPRHALLGLQGEVEEVEAGVEQLEARRAVEERLVVDPVLGAVAVGRARAAQGLLLVAAHDAEVGGEVREERRAVPPRGRDLLQGDDVRLAFDDRLLHAGGTAFGRHALLRAVAVDVEGEEPQRRRGRGKRHAKGKNKKMCVFHAI